MRIVIDMNLSPQWSTFLASHAIDAIHWSDVGAIDAPDEEIFDWAHANDRVVFTSDLDFGTLHALRATTLPSVIQLRCDETLPAGVGTLLLRAIRESREYLDSGALVTVDPRSHRVRILPIQRQKL
jgi:predicted nuclease of predicted toxin-antitoxin system